MKIFKSVYRLGARLAGCSPIRPFIGLDFRTAFQANKQYITDRFLWGDLRYGAVRTLVLAGAHEKVVREISGHKIRAVFDRYNILKTGDLNEAARLQEE